MTLIATKTLTAPRSTSKAVGTFYFRVLYDRDAGSDRTVVRIPDAVKLVDGKLPQLDFPPGSYEVRRDINGLDPVMKVAWSKFVVPDTGTGPLPGGAFNLYDLIGMVTDYPAPVVSAAVAAKQAAEAAAANAQATAQSLSAITAGAPEDFDTFAEVAAGKYAKPVSGIPKADMTSGVQTSLDKADASVSKAVADAAYAPRIPQQSTAPSNPAVGDLWLDTSA